MDGCSFTGQIFFELKFVFRNKDINEMFHIFELDANASQYNEREGKN